MERKGTIYLLLLLIPVIVFSQDLELNPPHADLDWVQYEPGPAQLVQLINNTDEEITWSASSHYFYLHNLTMYPSSGTVPANSSMPFVVMRSGNWYDGDHAITETQFQIVSANEGVEPATMFLMVLYEEATPEVVHFGIYQDQVVVGPENGYISFFIDLDAGYDQEYPNAHFQTQVHTAGGLYQTCINRLVDIPPNTTFFRHVVQPISENLPPGIHTYICKLHLQDDWWITKEFQFFKQ
jgi:hypothetical protein